MIKHLFNIAILIGGIALIPPNIITQAQQACFLQGADGRQIDLGHLCGKSQTTTVTDTKSFQIPIKRRVGGIPTVEVTFNGKHTFEMLFDTGASAIAISPSMAAILDIKVENTEVMNTPNGKITASIGRVASVQAGNYKAQNLQVGILPVENLALLGQNFYGHYDVTIKQKVIELRERD